MHVIKENHNCHLPALTILTDVVVEIRRSGRREWVGCDWDPRAVNLSTIADGSGSMYLGVPVPKVRWLGSRQTLRRSWVLGLSRTGEDIELERVLGISRVSCLRLGAAGASQYNPSRLLASWRAVSDCISSPLASSRAIEGLARERLVSQ